MSKSSNKLIRQRHEQGLCGRCGKKLNGISKKNCMECLARLAASQQRRYMQRRDDGQCLQCGVFCSTHLCTRCTGAQSECRRWHYEALCLARICIRCKKSSEGGTKALCLSCAAQQSKYQKEWRKSREQAS
jgi:hypothetical protein